jgi:hypothetical protein
MTLHEKEFLSQESKKVIGKLVIRLDSLSKNFYSLDVKSYEETKNNIKKNLNTAFELLDKAIVQ